jgi:molecular chaperone DnaK (HSP70)
MMQKEGINEDSQTKDFCQKVLRLTDQNSYKFRLEEIYGMMLANIRENAEAQTEEAIGYTALTIWDNSMSIRARKQLVDSLKLGGLKPFALVHENTAAAIKQAFNVEADKDMQAYQVVYVNVGSGGMKVSLVEFDKVKPKRIKANNYKEFNVKVTVLADKFDPGLGSNKIDKCLYDVVIAKFFKNLGQEWKEDTVSLKNQRQLMLNLLKTKKALSVSSEASVYFENIWNDQDLNVKVTREEVYAECKTLFDKTSQFLNKFKEEIVKSDLNFDKIKEVQLIGGGVRVPGVRKVIEDSWKTNQLEVFNHLNGDEAMAQGANYIAESFSGNPMHKTVEVHDGPNYDTHVKIKFHDHSDANSGFDKEGVLFEKKKSKYGTKKLLSLKGLEKDFLLRLQVEDEEQFWVEWQVQGFERVNKLLKERDVMHAKTNLYFELDYFGIPRLVKGEVQVTEKVKEKQTTKENKANEKDKKTENQAKTNTFVVILETNHFKNSFTSLSENPKEWERSLRILDMFKKEEKERKLILNIKNELETAIYEMKEIAESNEEKNKFLTEKEKKEFVSFSNELNKFLFENFPTKEELIQKKIDLKKVRNGFDIRYNEWVNRDLLIEKIFANFNKMQKDIIKIKESSSNVPDFKVAEIHEKIERSKAWLENIKKRFEEQELWVNPLITKSEIKERNNQMGALVSKLKKYNTSKKSYSRKLRRNKTLKENIKNDLKVDNKVLKEGLDEGIDKHLEDLVKQDKTNESESKAKTRSVEDTDL